MQSDLDLGPAGVAWVVNAYVLAFGGLLVLSGRVADLFGRRRMFVGGSVMFTVGTLLAATASSPLMLLGGRVVQGAGAAALSPAAMSLLLLTFPGPARARAMSLWGAASAVGGATGVFLGGLLTGAYGWQAVFLVTVPISLATAVLARRVLEEGSRGARHGFDALGATAITGAVVALVHGVLGLAQSGLTFSTGISLAAAAALAGSFVAIERRASEPLVPLDLFASRVMSTGIGLAVLGWRGSGIHVRAGRPVPAAGAALRPAARGPRHGPHLAHRFGGFPDPPAPPTARPRAAADPGGRSPGPGGRAPVAGLCTVGRRLHDRRPSGSAPGGSRRRPQLYPDDHGHRLRRLRRPRRAGIRSRRLGHAGRLALGTSVFTAIGIAIGGSATGTLGSVGFTAAFTAAAVVSLATAALGFTIARTGR